MARLRPLFGQERAHFSALFVVRVGADLFQDFAVSVVGEDHEAGAEMLFEIGCAGVRRHGAALTAIGREEEQLGFSAFDIGAENGGDARACDGLAEDDEAIGEIELRLIADDADFPDAVAFRGVEPGFTDRAKQVLSFPAASRAGKNRSAVRIRTSSV